MRLVNEALLSTRGVALFFATVLLASPLYAAPSESVVSWTPPQVRMALSPGTTTSTVVTVTAMSSVPATNVWLVAPTALPSVGPYLGVEPMVLPPLPAGGQQTLVLTFTLPDAIPFQTLSGVLQLRAEGATIAQVLPITVGVWPTYENPNADLRFLYPPGWTIAESDSSVSLASPARQLMLSDPDQEDLAPEMTVALLPNPAAQSIEDFTAGYDRGWFTNYISSQATVVGGRAAKRFSDLGAAVGLAPVEAVFVDASPWVILFRLNEYESSQSPAEHQLFDSLLASVSIE